MFFFLQKHLKRARVKKNKTVVSGIIVRKGGGCGKRKDFKFNWS
jgi:hypothetical protein